MRRQQRRNRRALSLIYVLRVETRVGERCVRRVRILIIHADEELLAHLRRGLRVQSYEVRTAANPHSALDLIRSWTPQIALAGFDGQTNTFRVFQQRLKAAAGAQLIAILNSRPGKLRMAALSAGADDYLSSPITMPELTARIALAVERASSSTSASTRHFETADLLIDLEERRVLVSGDERHLAAKEFDLLRCLLVNANRPVECGDLLRSLGMNDGATGKEALRVYICQLRKKLEPQPSKPRYIRTVARIGYRFDAGPNHNAFLMSA